MYALDHSLRLFIILRLVTIPVSFLSIVAFAHAIGRKSWSDAGIDRGWGTVYLEESAYFPVCPPSSCVALERSGGSEHPSKHGHLSSPMLISQHLLQPVLSLVYTVVSFACFAFKKRQIAYPVDIAVDVIVFGTNVVPISFTISVYGPMQRYISRSNLSSDDTFAGMWELVGVVSLCVLEYVSNTALRRH